MIREFKSDDRPTVDEMQFDLQRYFASVDSTGESAEYKNIAAAHQYMEKMLEDVKNMNGQIFVAEENGEIVGFVQGVIIVKDNIKEGWVGLLYVKPAFRRSSIGKQLLDRIKDYFISESCNYLKLLVLADNAPAISFYEKNGFKGHNVEMSVKL